MKIIATIVSVAALVGTIACGTSDTPVAQTDTPPTARPTIEALIPIVTPANTLTLITPTPANTPAPNSRQSNSATPAATVASPTPTPANLAPRPTTVKPTSAGGLVMIAKPTATPTPTPAPNPTATPGPALTSYSAQFSQQDYDQFAATLPYPPEGLPIPPPSKQSSDRHPTNRACSAYEPRGIDDVTFLNPQAPVIDNTADGTLGSPSHQHHQEYAEAVLISDIVEQYHAAVGSRYEQWADTGDHIAANFYWDYDRKLPLENECIQFEVMHPRLPIVRYLWEATLPNPDWEFDPDDADDQNRYHHWQLHGYFIITDKPHPDHPDTQKIYATRQLGEVSMLQTTNVCERILKPRLHMAECQ